MSLKHPLWPRFLSTAAVLNCATLGPLGRRLPAPGTWGSAAGLLYFTVFFAGRYGTLGTLLLSAIGVYVAIGLCGEAEFRLGKRDPGEIILDELVAIPLCFLGWPVLAIHLPNWLIFLVGFALFRLFDIAKPFGIKRLQNLPAGWGVVMDDVAAALAACVTVHGLAFLAIQFSWI